MASSWANSWLSRWSNSWGTLFTPPYIPTGLRIVQALFQNRAASSLGISRTLLLPPRLRTEQAAGAMRIVDPDLSNPDVAPLGLSRTLDLPLANKTVITSPEDRMTDVATEVREATSEGQSNIVKPQK